MRLERQDDAFRPGRTMKLLAVKPMFQNRNMKTTRTLVISHVPLSPTSAAGAGRAVLNPPRRGEDTVPYLRTRVKTGAILVLAALALAPLSLWAQPTPNPPGQISFQGFLTDANGIPLATNTPKNYDVNFRLYTAPNGGAAIWAEAAALVV